MGRRRTSDYTRGEVSQEIFIVGEYAVDQALRVK